MDPTYSIPVGVLESYLSQYASLAREVGLDPKVASSLDKGAAASASQSYNILSILGVDRMLEDLPVPCDQDGPLSKPGIVGLLRAAMVRIPVTTPSHDQALLMESGVYEQVTIPPCGLGDRCCFVSRRETISGLSTIARGRPLRPLCQYMTPAELSDLVDLRKAPVANGISCLLCLRRHMTAIQLAFITVLDHLAPGEHPVDYVLQPFISAVVGDDAYNMDSVFMPRTDAYTGMVGPFAKYDLSKIRATMHPHLKDCVVLDQTAMHTTSVPRSLLAIGSSTSLAQYALSKESLFRKRSNDSSWRAGRSCTFVEYHDPVASLLRANPTRSRSDAAALAAANSGDPTSFVSRTVFDPCTPEYPTCHTLSDMGPLATDGVEYLCGRRLTLRDPLDIVVAKCVPVHSFTRAFAVICQRTVAQHPRAASYLDAIVRCAVLGNYPSTAMSLCSPVGQQRRSEIVAFLGPSPCAKLIAHNASVVVVWCVRLMQVYRWDVQAFLSDVNHRSLYDCVCETVASFRQAAADHIDSFVTWCESCVDIAAKAHAIFRRDCLLARAPRRRVLKDTHVPVPSLFPLDYDTFVLHTRTNAPVTLAWCGVCGKVQTAVAGLASAAVAGFVKSISTNRASISCNSGDPACRNTPLTGAVMVGRVAIRQGVSYMLCTGKNCGRMTIYTPDSGRYGIETQRFLCPSCAHADRCAYLTRSDPYLGRTISPRGLQCDSCQRYMSSGTSAKRARGAMCAPFNLILCVKCNRAAQTIDVDNRLHFIDRIKETLACNALHSRGPRFVKRRVV